MAAKKAAKKAPTPKVMAPTGELSKNKRAVLRMTEADFNRLRWEILPDEQISWQDLLSGAVNDWLRAHGHAPLEGVQ